MGKLLKAFTEYYNSHTKEQRKADMDELEPYNHVGMSAGDLIKNIKKVNNMDTDELKKLVAQYDTARERYNYTLISIHNTKDQLRSGCINYVYCIGDDEGRERGYRIERENLRDYRYCTRRQSIELKELKMKIKAMQRKISKENAEKHKEDKNIK